MKRAAKPQPSPLERALSDVDHAVSGDSTRPHLNRPFGALVRGRGFVGGTDGHRLAIVQCNEWEAAKRDQTPPIEHVIPWDAPTLGWLVVDAFEDARAIPARWQVGLAFDQRRSPTLTIGVPSGSGKKSKLLRPFGTAPIEPGWIGGFLENLNHELSIELSYLLDALDFVGTNSVKVWNGGVLDPIAFTPFGAASIESADRIAVVMPRKG
jgi:hypothetical protein